MGDWNLSHEAIKTALSGLSAIAALAASWFIGQRLTYLWNVRQKRREMQMSASQQFYIAYGEFFAVWKLWNRLDSTSPQYDDRRWELHKRSAAAEAIVEGILVKLCSELTLDKRQVRDLACFRQGFQQLRISIRQGQPLPWATSEEPAYKAFKTLAIRTAGLLNGKWHEEPPHAVQAAEQLIEVTRNSWDKVWMTFPEN